MLDILIFAALTGLIVAACRRTRNLAPLWWALGILAAAVVTVVAMTQAAIDAALWVPDLRGVETATRWFSAALWGTPILALLFPRWFNPRLDD